MELRKDYILDRWVIISEDRGKRPKEFIKETIHELDVCFFCPGNESHTPPEIGRIGSPNWQVRWFENKYPFIKQEGTSMIETHNQFYTFSNPYGHHEIIVETPNHKKQLAALTEEQITMVLKAYCDRINKLSKEPSIMYVQVFKNSGRDAGTSLVHSHSQVAAYNLLPTLIQEEVNVSKKFSSCPYCSIIQTEKQSFRRIFENEHFVSFSPYASRFNYEAWIFSKAHIKSITEMNDAQLSSLAQVLKKILSKLAELGLPYNYFLHNAPMDQDLHFHIEICPRKAIWGGFELATDTYVNSVSPETAAAFYRGES